MARGVNKVILIGNLGNDPEVKSMPNGNAVTTISLATSESWKDRQTGEPRERTEWHRVVFFGKLAEIAGQYLRKGAKVYVEGALRTRKWQDQSGQDRYTTEVVVDMNGQMQMLDSRGGDMGGGYQQDPGYSQPEPSRQNSSYAASAPQSASQSTPQSAPQSAHAGNFDDFDDDIPF